jgi:hypothetical protein
MPHAKHRDDLQAVLTKVYGYTAAGGPVAMVRSGTNTLVARGEVQ